MTMAFYTLVAFPASKTRLKNFFSEDGASPGWLLTAAPRLRPAGFDLSTSGYAHLVDGEYWEATSGDRKRVRLYQDGTLIFRARADSAFLGWGQDPHDFANVPALNPVAVVESHASFCSVYGLILQHLAETPESVRIDLSFSNATIGSKRLFLTRYYPQGVSSVLDPKPYYIHDVNASDSLVAPLREVRESPFSVAYQLLVRFYKLFDAEPDLIPLTSGTGSQGSVNLEALKAL